MKGTWKIINKIIHNSNKTSKIPEIHDKDGEKIENRDIPTECMLIGSHKKLQQNRNDFLIEIDNAPIECVNVSKSPGVMIDETLTWHCHVDLITKKG